LHKPRLLFDLKHFRGGTLEDPDNFESHLAVIYALALIPMTEDECLLELGQVKSSLMDSFKEAAQRGLGRLNVATTHKILSLQTLVLYVVSLYPSIQHMFPTLAAVSSEMLSSLDIVILDWGDVFSQWPARFNDSLRATTGCES
jgi:hypothetical protein